MAKTAPKPKKGQGNASAKLKKKSRPASSDDDEHVVKDNSIPKPEGQYQRDFFLPRDLETKLSDRRWKKHGTIIRRCAGKYLQPGVTMRNQECRLVELTVQAVLKEIPMYKAYRDSWPVRCQLQRQLQNKSSRKKAEVDDSDDSEDSGEKEAPSRKRKRKAVASDEEDEDDPDKSSLDDSDDEEQPPPRKKNISIKIPPKTIPVSKNTRPASKASTSKIQDPAAKKNVAPSKQKHSNCGQQDSALDVEASGSAFNLDLNKDDIQLADKILVTNKADEILVMNKADEEEELSDEQNDDEIALSLSLPHCCPLEDCDHLLPATPSLQLRLLFLDLERQTCLNPYSGKVLGTQIDICNFIKQDKNRQRVIRLAKEQNWPEQIDFATLAAKIPTLTQRISRIVHEPEILKKNMFWIDLQVDKSAIIKGNLQVELSRASATRPGYYGEKGCSIIQATLLATFGKTPTSNANFAPLSFVKFIEYVLVPSVAVTFIMQDRNITAMEAKLVMQRSAEYGSFMFTAEDDDVDLDNILDSIYRNAKLKFPSNVQAPPKQQRKENVSESSERNRPKPKPATRPKPTPVTKKPVFVDQGPATAGLVRPRRTTRGLRVITEDEDSD